MPDPPDHPKDSDTHQPANTLPVLWQPPTKQNEPPQPETPDQRIERELRLTEKWRTAFELHDSGTTYPDIAAHLGCSVSTAHRYVTRHLETAGPHPEVERYRSKHLARLDRLRRNIITEAEALPTEDRPWTLAAKALLEIDAAEARLVSLPLADGPRKTRFSDMTDEELIAYVGLNPAPEQSAGNGSG